MNNDIEITKGPFLKNIIKFALPLALTGVLQLLYNAADIIVVGRFSDENSLAAIGATTSLINLIINILLGLSVGASVAVAKYTGAKNYEKVQKIIHTAILLSIVCGIAVGIFGAFASKTMLIWMKTPENILDLAAVYLTVYFVGTPVNMLYTFGAAIMRGTGDTKKPLLFLSLSGIVNVCLNLIFVIVFRMNVLGVALATIISQGVSAALVIKYLRKRPPHLRLSLRKLKFHTDELIEIVRIGLPAGIQGSIFSISNVLVQSSINSFGSQVVAGNTAASSIEGFVYISMNAFHHAALTFTGHSFGAKKPENFKKILICCLFLVTVTGLVLGTLASTLGNSLISIYNKNPDVIKYGASRLAVICATYFLCGIMDVIAGQLRALGYSLMPMLITIFCVCGLRIFWVFTIFAANRTQTTLYLAYPVSWLTAALFLFAYYFIVIKKAKARALSENFNAEEIPPEVI